MSGWDAFYTLDHGQVREAADMDEFEDWHHRNPGGLLLSTPVLGMTVQTIFTGRHSAEYGFNDYVEPFESSVIDVPLYGVRGADHWKGALYEHDKMVDAVIHRWLCTFQKDAGAVEPGPLRGPTILTEVAKSSGCSLPSPASPQVASTAQGGPKSLRWRLLHLLSGKALNWFAINRSLETTPDKCLDALTSAWSEGLLIRTESGDPWVAPTFSLSALGDTRLRAGDFTVNLCRATRADPDLWQAGWEPWMDHACPACGGFLGSTRGGDLVCVVDVCQPGQVYRDRHYTGTLKDGHLVEATVRKGEHEFYVSYSEGRHEKRKSGKILRAAPGTASDEQIRNYVCSAFA